MPGRHALAVVALALLVGAGPPRAPSAAGALSDQDFWRLTTELSEPGGRFPAQLMSNEDSQAFIMPALLARGRASGAYLGVGQELNFTYLAALQPPIAFVVDIRGDNLLELLMYKALFELSGDRAGFVARLFSRPRPANVGDSTTVTGLFDALAPAPADPGVLEETTRAVLARLTDTHGFPLGGEERTSIAHMLAAFQRLGPAGLRGFGDRTHLTYREMMAVTDLDGRQHGFLATEERYRAVRELEQRNLIVGVTGDFAGDHALAGIGREIARRGLGVDVFYVSNVERYLLEQGEHGRQFYRNVAALPLTSSALFIRSVRRDISARLGIALPPGPTTWWTWLFSIRDCLGDFAAGRIQTYPDLFTSPL